MNSLHRDILKLSIPNVLSNIAVPLAGMIDVAIMGHLGSGLYIGAIALGAMIFNFLYWGLGFLRMGTTGLTAQAYGAGEGKEMGLVLARGLLIAATGSVLLLILQHPIGQLAFGLIHGEPAVEQQAAVYFSVRIWAAPATLMLYVFYGWFIGMQNSVIPAVIAVLASVVNAVTSYLLVFYTGMKADGVALGTVISQYTALLLAATCWYVRYHRKLPPVRWKQVLELTPLGRMMQLNGNIFIRTLCLMAVMTFFTSRSAVYGTGVLAANTLLFQFFVFFSYFADGFAYAGEALTGRFIGRGDRAELLRSVRALFLWGGIIAVLFTSGYLGFGSYLPAILTNDSETNAIARPYLFWTVLIPAVSFAAFLWDGIYIGATAGRQMRNVMLAASAGVFFPAYFLLAPAMGNHALWLAMLLFLATRSLMMTLLSGKVLRGQGTVVS
ncbi:MAG TPA: MATE family efflux transporter [Bacteroidales bacterium]|nr:MATE family efflux transporter [Bacteroidales bacterium]HRZ49060.1 MATE family efflux transporter [Bacteroidales bacterium]